MMNSTTPNVQTLNSSAGQPSLNPFTRCPRSADAVLALVAFLVGVSVSHEDPNQEHTIRALSDIPIVHLIVLAMVYGALYWRRSQPLAVLGGTLAVLALIMTFGYSYDLYGMPIALYSVGRFANKDKCSYFAVGVTLVLVGISTFVDGEPVSSIGFSLVFVTGVWYMGRRIRVRGDYLKLLQDRAAQLEWEKDSEARRAVAEERTRIARELHDVVAHQVSLMTVQAGAATTVAADDPEGALQAMKAVEEAGRRALVELRHLMGVLRPEAEEDDLVPQPGLADIPRLVEHLKEAGLQVTLTMGDVLTDLPARVNLSTYRIVQEALTNVLKHAGPSARTEVRLSSDKHGITIEVLDDGHGATILPGAGHGLAGMRERAQLLGGSLDAGPRPGGGFQVIARLPVEEEPL